MNTKAKDKKTKEQYDLEILKTTGKTDHRLNGNSNNVYYDFDYLKALLEDMRTKGKGEAIIKKFTKELQPGENGKFKMCSVASSARLAYLHFKDTSNMEFEANLPIDLKDKKRKPSAQPDAYTKEGKRIFYECKCHEIFDSHSSEKLSVRYKEVVKKYFGVSCDVDGDTLALTQAELGIGGKDLIYKMHFNVKQLLCHLMGIAENKEKKEPAELRYVFFIPSSADEFEVVRELKKEIESIKRSVVIRKMLESNNITLESFDFVNVREVADPIYDSL